MRLLIPSLMGALSVLIASTAGAGPVALVATGADSEGRAASATFERIDGNLVIKLSNLSTGDALTKQDVLTGVYFTTGTSESLTTVGAIVADGSQLLHAEGQPDRFVGGEWGYREGDRVMKRTGGSADHAIGAAKLRMFNRGSMFPGENLGGGESAGKLDFGLVGINDQENTGTAKLTGDLALIQHEVVFVLSGVSADFNALSDISNVVFQYGTSLRRGPQLAGTDVLLSTTDETLADEINELLPLPGLVANANEPNPNPIGAPAPSALAGGLALLSFAAGRFRRTRSA